MVNIFILLLFMTIIGAFGGYSFKRATEVDKLHLTLLKPWIYVGALLYVMSAVLNIYILKYLPYTVVLPATSITYIWTMIISKVFLSENITVLKITGICLIFVGVGLISI